MQHCSFTLQHCILSPFDMHDVPRGTHVQQIKRTLEIKKNAANKNPISANKNLIAANKKTRSLQKKSSITANKRRISITRYLYTVNLRLPDRSNDIPRKTKQFHTNERLFLDIYPLFCSQLYTTDYRQRVCVKNEPFICREIVLPLAVLCHLADGIPFLLELVVRRICTFTYLYCCSFYKL